jgi:photosystem II stability/assembly factor-like uncharacterized protein
MVLSQYLGAQQWQPVPLTSKEIKDAGNFAGEGCQWPQAIEVDATDGSFLLFGTDVGGIFKSTNGGEMWEPCNIGYNPRGNCGFAIDPNNNHRALAVGGNSTENWSHGLYLTTDQAKSWANVLEEDGYKGYRGFKDKVSFDKSSFDSGLGYSTIAYWSNPAGGLYKSTDGGQTWGQINTKYGDCVLKVDPGNGTLYLGNNEGLFISHDGGENITSTFSGEIRDISVTGSDSAFVLISTANALHKSTNSGDTFSKVPAVNYPGNVATLQVCPSNKSKLIVCNNSGDYNKPIYRSNDGGINWEIAPVDNVNAFMPFNGRTHKFAWHPANENKIWAFGGDWITSSSNGGGSFEWDANGYTGIAPGETFNFTVSENILYFAATDYNGAVTLDNGQTWKYCPASGFGWGGTMYAGYAANKDVLVSFNKEDGKLTISFDGGNKFTKTNNVCTGFRVSNGDPKDANVIYVSNWRSVDLGKTWAKMNGCDGVFTANLKGDKQIYGGIGTDVVRSDDKGLSWQKVTSVPGSSIRDIAYDADNNKLYIVANNRLFYVFENNKLTDITGYLLANQYGEKGASSVAVDPTDPRVVYVTHNRNIYASDVSFLRSRDAGNTWEVLTRNQRANNGQFGKDGAREAVWARVNPFTRECWVATSCYGLWKIAAPDTVPYSFPVTRINSSKEVLIKNETFQLVVTETHFEYPTITWSSSDTTIAKVDSTGLVTALAQGSATITATIFENSAKLSCTITINGEKKPFGEIPRPIPGIIEVEDFDEGGQGIGYNDATIINEGGEYRINESVGIQKCGEGGFNVGWIDGGEWLSYSVVVGSTAKYDINVRTAVNAAAKIEIVFSNGEITTGEISLSPSGGWQAWKTFTKKGVQLNAGEQDMKVLFKTSGFNLNYIDIQPAPLVSVNQLAGESNISMFPNPFEKGTLTIETSNINQSVKLSIHSCDGRTIFNGNYAANDKIGINRGVFSKGIYLINLSSNDYTESMKLIVR